MNSTDQMTFNEFISWATGYVVICLGHGDSLRTIMYQIVTAVQLNQVFGGMKPKDK